MLDLVLEIHVTHILRHIIVRNNWHRMPVTNTLKQGTLNIKVINIIDTEYYSMIWCRSQCETGRRYHIDISAIPKFIIYVIYVSISWRYWCEMRLLREIYHSGIPTDNIDMCYWISCLEQVSLVVPFSKPLDGCSISPLGQVIIPPWSETSTQQGAK